MSALIFVALAVAWAVYLVPKALKHHDEDARSRTVDRFSHTLRVLARREPVDKKTARLVTPEGRSVEVESQVEVTIDRHAVRAEKRAAKAERRAAREAEAAQIAASLTPAQVRARRAAARRATARRRNVLGALVLVNLVVVGLAAFAVVAWPYVAIPAVLLVAWLVLCRVMVRGEQCALPARSEDRTTVEPSTAPTPVEAEHETVDEPDEVADEPDEPDEVDPMEDTSAGIAAIVDPAMWDPVPVTLPTYVTKPAATRRTVRTIDLDSTGVWTSGRTDADAQLAREADEADKAARSGRDGDDTRAVGS
ncbi:hypothetical protein [Nocardioides sp. YIM 152315]|uniref:divisome protein SepX/GlpR n=1 Tax=Nocardioides sp. YIM 152315 TaxID=3031760 RepID=UPI0023D9B365|nr:hypothetical protein [Nocardioides sp. YIM 152315]MDF1605917.1 hypothetical protein [Nocardioides sp. YIM 152315]